MKLTNRQIKLLKLINNYPNYTLKQITSSLEVTSQTIKTELKSLEPLLQSYSISINLVKGKTLEVDGIGNLTEMLKETECLVEFPIKNQILLTLILNEDFLVFQDIADKLYVSKSLVEKQMSLLSKEYKNDIQALRHYGVRYSASQVERRALFVKLMSSYIKGLNFEKEMQEFNDLHFPILDYFSNEDIVKVKNSLEVIRNTTNFVFTDESFRQLFLYLLFIVRLYKDEVYQYIGDGFIDMVKKLRNTEPYIIIADQVKHSLEIECCEGELYYISYLFMTLKKQRIFDSKEIVNEMSSFIKNIFVEINDNLSMDLSDDEILFEGLALHIYTTMFPNSGFQYCEKFYSWQEIKRQYPLAFEMAAIVVQNLEKGYGYEVKSDDITYITLHFQASIERMKSKLRKIRTIVICHYGVAAANLISEKCRRLFYEIDVIRTYSIQEYMNTENIDCDLILTTEQIPKSDIPTIYITPILRERELDEIRSFVDNKKISQRLDMKILEAEVIDGDENLSPEEFIKLMVGKLIQDGDAEEEYLESVLQRERVSPTNFNNIAIPHGNAKYVNESRLIIGRFKNPIKWNDSYVNIVFLFAFSSSIECENHMVISTFYRKLAKPEIEEALESYTNEENDIFKQKLVKLFNRL